MRAAVLLLLLLLLLLLGLLGCANPAPAGPMLVPVPVPVGCRKPVPERPVIPTELLPPGPLPWVLIRAALAEIDRREGYELQLRAALVVCTAAP